MRIDVCHVPARELIVTVIILKHKLRDNIVISINIYVGAAHVLRSNAIFVRDVKLIMYCSTRNNRNIRLNIIKCCHDFLRKKCTVCTMGLRGWKLCFYFNRRFHNFYGPYNWLGILVYLCCGPVARRHVMYTRIVHEY